MENNLLFLLIFSFIIIICILISLFYINNTKTNKKIGIVYFICINHDRDWNLIVKSQLTELIESNILSDSELNIVVVDEKNIVTKEYFDNILIGHNFNIEFHNKNQYEYWGLKKIHELAKKDPSKIYLYLHTKGMFFNISEERNIFEVYLTKDILNNYKKAIKIFNENKNINKIGTLPSIDGFIWFNFFYIRGTNLNKLKPPIISEDRFYYEGYIGNENNNLNDSYSLYFDDIIKLDNELTSEIAFSNFTLK